MVTDKRLDDAKALLATYAAHIVWMIEKSETASDFSRVIHSCSKLVTHITKYVDTKDLVESRMDVL